jgi:NAD(P)-dependent dehydrogenase (short-subunit alcohol dehydrogenase family)
LDARFCILEGGLACLRDLAQELHMASPHMAPLLDLSGKLAVVTGAARGIGFATCRLLASQGARLVLADRDQAATKTAAETLRAEGFDVQASCLDVTDEAAVSAAFAAWEARRGPADILINNAGVSIRKALTDLSLEEWETVQRVNVTGAFLCCREAARRMIERRTGTIINVASVMGLSGGGPYPNPAYKTSKGALVNFTRALAVELAPWGVRVNAVAPTWVRTAFIGALTEDVEMYKRIEALMPLGRIADAEEVAAAILFLASGMSSIITGHTLPVDGGFLAQ